MSLWKKTIIANTALMAMTSGLAYADEDDEDEWEYIPFFEFIAMGGIANLDADDASIDVTRSETDRLVQTDDDDWENWTGRLGIGYNYPLTDEFNHEELVWFPIITPQLNFYYLNGDTEGEIQRFEDPSNTPENFDMEFISKRVMFDLSLTLATYEHVSVYVLGGAGVSWNDVDFSSHLNGSFDCGCELTPLSLEAEDSSSFAYEFGAGINYAVFDHLTLSVEYLFTGITDVQLGDSDTEETDLVFGGTDMDINTQAVLAGIRVAL